MLLFVVANADRSRAGKRRKLDTEYDRIFRDRKYEGEGWSIKFDRESNGLRVKSQRRKQIVC